MRRVIVADDEKFIRLGLKTMLEKNPEREYEVTLSRDGLETLKLIDDSDVKYDLVITDIRMPEMTGLEFLEKIKDYEDKPEVIILSGYDEFNFAVQALRNGAREYILKPINRNTLSKALNAVERELEKKEKNNKKQKTLDNYESELNINKLKYLFLKEYTSDEELAEAIDRIDINMLKEDFYIGVITTNTEQNMKSNEGALLENSIKELLDDEILFVGPQNELILISNDKEVFFNLRKYFIDTTLFQYTIGISNLCDDIKRIKEGYNEACKAAKYKIIFNENIVIEYNDIKDKNIEYKVPVQEIEKLYNIIGTDREVDVEDIIEGILDSKQLKDNDIDYLENIANNINMLIFEDLKKRFLPTHDVVYKRGERLSNIYNFTNVREYAIELKQYILQVSTHLKDINDIGADCKNITRALKYINDNYNKDITMATVSNEVSLNYSYFSHVFKEHTGDNFVNYLRKIRVEKAKEILEVSDMKIYEVAKNVGYEDPKQFAKMFRKVVGISPAEYKDKYYRGIN